MRQMNPPTSETHLSNAANEAAVRALYQQLMDAWNNGSGDDYAVTFAEDGILVGFDGTAFNGRQEIVSFQTGFDSEWTLN